MTLISFVCDEFRVISISGDAVSFTVTCVVIDVLTLSSSSSPLNIFLIGHSESAFWENSGPFFQELSATISFGFFPLVIQSAMLSSPSIQYQSLGFVPSFLNFTNSFRCKRVETVRFLLDHCTNNLRVDDMIMFLEFISTFLHDECRQSRV